MTSSKEEMGRLAAELYAVVCVESHNISVDVVNVISDLVDDTLCKVSDIVVCCSV